MLGRFCSSQSLRETLVCLVTHRGLLIDVPSLPPSLPRIYWVYSGLGVVLRHGCARWSWKHAQKPFEGNVTVILPSQAAEGLPGAVHPQETAGRNLRPLASRTRLRPHTERERSKSWEDTSWGIPDIKFLNVGLLWTQ